VNGNSEDESGTQEKANGLNRRDAEDADTKMRSPRGARRATRDAATGGDLEPAKPLRAKRGSLIVVEGTQEKANGLNRRDAEGADTKMRSPRGARRATRDAATGGDLEPAKPLRAKRGSLIVVEGTRQDNSGNDF